MFDTSSVVSLGCDCSIKYQSSRYYHQKQTQESVEQFESALLGDAFGHKKGVFITHFFDWVVSSDRSMIELTNVGTTEQVLDRKNYDLVQGTMTHRLGIKFPHHFEGAFDKDHQKFHHLFKRTREKIFSAEKCLLIRKLNGDVNQREVIRHLMCLCEYNNVVLCFNEMGVKGDSEFSTKKLGKNLLIIESVFANDTSWKGCNLAYDNAFDLFERSSVNAI